ncbi:hypothetical protein HPT25_02990 [Bacillus sp. BRMEA1]|uniref:hypothetical protein n=1 Tax=Neobacillus endophyticus TaxID=2738405 RepID=UPI00156584F4|nr:hypothetical protein [Neobacillus endophyticus]NRD76455.1 hypothetical protein [Neobacillus endophyticus]
MCPAITKVSYHIVGPVIFVLGLLLVLRLPNIEGLLGNCLFNLPAGDGTILLRIAAAIMQMAGILLFLKWFDEHGKEEHVKLYKKYEPLILIFLIFLSPIILNAAIDSTVKAYVYAGKSGGAAVEIIAGNQPCGIDRQKGLAKCSITLKNYNHVSQKVNLQLTWKKLSKTNTTPVYLIKRQEKTVYLQIPLPSSELKQLGTKAESQQPVILIQ